MANQIDLYSPRHLMEVVKIAPPVHTFMRDTFFKGRKYSNTDKVDVDIKKGTRKMAPFVHPRIGSKTVSGSGYTTKTYTPPLVAPDMVTTADNLLKRMPGETIYSPMSPEQRAVKRLAEEHTELDDMIARREEWMCAQAIFAGSIPIVGEGVNETIDFGFTNKETLTGTKKWGASACDMMGDLKRWKQQVSKTGFVNVDMAIFSPEALTVFLNDEKILKKMDTRNYNFGVLDWKNPIPGVTFVGHLNEVNMDIYTYDEVFLDDWTDPAAPDTKPLVPANTVTLLSTKAAYTMAYAILTALDDASKQWYSVEGPRLLRSYAAHKPDRLMLEETAKPLPVPVQVDSWFVATVL